jgi:hypothetical protein
VDDLAMGQVVVSDVSLRYTRSSLHKGSHSLCIFKRLETSALAKDAARSATTKIASGMAKSLAITEAIREVQLL